MKIREMGMELAEEYIEELVEEMDTLKQDLASARLHLRSERGRVRKEEFQRINFKQVKVVAVKYPNYVVRRTKDGGMQTKHAKWWGTWEQCNIKGELIKVWEAPCIRKLAPYPEFIKPLFVSYHLHKWHEPTFTPVPDWFRSLLPVQHKWLPDPRAFMNPDRGIDGEEPKDYLKSYSLPYPYESKKKSDKW